MAATASVFQIAQDSEKENPRHLALKEKMTGKSNILQPLGASTMGGVGVGNHQQIGGGVRGGGVPLKQGRANFAVLNSNANVRAAAVTHHHHNNNNNNLIHGGAGNNKVVSLQQQ